MSNHVPIPVVSEVTALEVLQSGGATKKPLTEEQEKVVGRFIQAHRGSQAEPQADSSKGPKAQMQRTSEPQVNSQEQAAAVAARGRSQGDSGRDIDPSEKLYKLLYTDSANFLSLDLESLQQSLASRSKCLADLAGSLSPEQKVVRKYLLVQILKQQDGLSPADKKALLAMEKGLLAKSGELLSTLYKSLDAGLEMGLYGIELGNYIKAYQLTIETPDILLMFRGLKLKNMDGDLIQKIKGVLDRLCMLAERDSAVSKSDLAEERHSNLRRRIHYLRILLRLLRLHTAFLDFCQRSGMAGLQEIDLLVETYLNSVTAAEMNSAAANVIKQASSVSWKRSQVSAPHVFILNYLPLFRDPQFKHLYRISLNSRLLMDVLAKNIKTNGVLAMKVMESASNGG